MEAYMLNDLGISIWKRHDDHPDFVIKDGFAFPKWISCGNYSTPFERPYGYGAHVIRGPIKKLVGDDLISDYDDRLRSFYHEKWGDACRLLEGQRLKSAPLGLVSKFLSFLYGKEVKCVQVFEGCNVGNGYPYLIFVSRKLPAQGMGAGTAETGTGSGLQPASPVPQECAQGGLDASGN